MTTSSDEIGRLALLRADLVSRCDRGVVPQRAWHDRDSADAQIQLATLRVLLLAGCDFALTDTPASDERTTWVNVSYEGFQFFEGGDLSTELFYVPTSARLDDTSGKDWY